MSKAALLQRKENEVSVADVNSFASCECPSILLLIKVKANTSKQTAK